ncbi:MAG: Gfo/Idh/MocA family oxidoreductase [Planctomycetota bacterium]|nr:Gfo/Idh/MocA family oxidoreductase [Planctomycetota bacterium]
MAKKTINVALIGQKFMGRAHSNAWGQVGRFFDLPRKVNLHTIAARDKAELEPFAEKWGWGQASGDWRELCENPEIDLVDVGTPNDVHAEQALALLEAGKHVACEKPLAGTLEDARAMRDAARKRKQLSTFVWFNYRRCPAMALMHQLVQEGKIGEVVHVRGHYLQSWGGPETPLVWRFQKKRAGSGAHGDLNAHIVDMARFVTGDEVAEINGSIAKTWIKERPHPDGKGKGRSDVDDQVVFLATFKQGATASFEASRLAHGHHNRNFLEINGTKGSVAFDFEHMNVLRFLDATEDPRIQGWRRIMCTSAGNHPYAENWWPDAHVLGYEHGFVNMAADIVRCLSGKRPVVPLPDFADAYETQRVLEAALISAKERCAIKMSEVK